MKRGIFPVLALAMTISAGTAARADPPPVPAPADAKPATAAMGAALDLGELDKISGGESVKVSVINDQTLSATSSGNSINADTVMSGGVNFAAGAFSGFNGVGNFVINTGNNNTLQGSLSVNVVALP